MSVISCSLPPQVLSLWSILLTLGKLTRAALFADGRAVEIPVFRGRRDARLTAEALNCMCVQPCLVFEE